MFIHGWLFGSYIWKNIQECFPNVSSSELVSLPGYYKSSTNEHSRKVIDDVLESSQKDDMIIAYSYTAARILLSSELNKCDATVILINPFLKPKTTTTTDLTTAPRRALPRPERSALAQVAALAPPSRQTRT